MTASIDRNGLRDALRELRGSDLFILLDRAIDQMPEELLPKWIEKHILPEQIPRSDTPPRCVLEQVRRFHEEALGGDYHDDTWDRSREIEEESLGTQLFIADCHRILDLCVAATSQGDYADARNAFELIFDLLREVDEGRDDILSFFDDRGVWQFGIDWGVVFRAWLRCLAQTSSPLEYARSVSGAIDAPYILIEREVLREFASQAGSLEQRAALKDEGGGKC
jgi:hypothetical protein